MTEDEVRQALSRLTALVSETQLGWVTEDLARQERQNPSTSSGMRLERLLTALDVAAVQTAHMQESMLKNLGVDTIVFAPEPEEDAQSIDEMKPMAITFDGERRARARTLRWRLNALKRAI